MWKPIGRIVCFLAVLTMLGGFMPAVVQADDQDYNSYWQEQTESPQQEQIEVQQKQQDYNAYWQEQAEQPPQQ